MIFLLDCHDECCVCAIYGFPCLAGDFTKALEKELIDRYNDLVYSNYKDIIKDRLKKWYKKEVN